MKSIIEEASSIGKAIETAWTQAGKPTEFTIRIFEESQKNMFGFTSKPAKIGIFYEESKKHEKPQQHVAAPREHQKQLDNQKNKENDIKTVVNHKQKEVAIKPAPIVKPKREEVEQADPWNEQMITYTNDWLTQLLKGLNVPNTFVITPERYHLKISFNGSIFEQPEKNRAFFRSCAHLLLQSIRNNFKRPLKGFKIILTAE